MSFKDMDLTAKIRASIAQDESLKASDINVETQNGVVTLTGNVPDVRTKQHVEEMIQAVSEVNSIHDELKSG